MTTLSVRALAVTDRNELAALVEGNLPALEPGLSLLERRFPAGQVLVDFLALDAGRRLVLCLLGSGSDTAMLVQAVEAYGWCDENVALLERLFPGARIDTTVPPRLVLLAPRFSDSLRRTARYLGPLSPALVECRCLEVNGARGVCFEAVEGMPIPEPSISAVGNANDVGSTRAEAPQDAAPARVRRLVRHLERLSFREAFR